MTKTDIPYTNIAKSSKDDRIFPLTRLVAALVVPVLVLAFIILYLTPDQSGQRFAWEIKPHMMARFIGAGYLGGAFLFVNVIFGRRWHRVAPGFPPVTAFTVGMLLATGLHWSRFDIRHFPFQLWLVLYVITPFLVPWLGWNNRVTDSGAPEADDLVVPRIARLALGGLGVVLLGFAVGAFVAPAFLQAIWPWALTPLTARIMGGWLALLGTGGVAIGRESRWSAWRVGLGSIGLWHALVLLGAALSPGDFTQGYPFNWYLISVAVVLLGMAGLFIYMETSRSKQKT